MQHLPALSRGYSVVRARSLVLAAVIGAGPLLTACSDESGAAETDATAPGADRSTPVDASDTAGGVPRISFATLTHDFGVLPDTESAATSFAFTNTGTGKLVISNVKASCGCTVPTLKQTELLPGEGATIDVIFDPSGRAGDLTKHISVVSNAQPENVTKLTISAHVEAIVRLDAHMLTLGTLEVGREHRRSFDVYYSDPRTEITGIEVNHPHITARLVNAGTRAAANAKGAYRATIEAVVKDDAPWGVLNRVQLTFRASTPAAAGAERAEASYHVSIGAVLQGDLRAKPPMVMATSGLTAGQAFEASSILSRASRAPFTISDLRLEVPPVPDAVVRVKEISASAYRIIVEGTAPETSGAIKGSVALRTNVPGEQDLVILFAAYV
ncbi:MAG: DUF1573 domain-containing protein, partial [Planctomycetota bacterium]